jgi:hypothetical protein
MKKLNLAAPFDKLATTRAYAKRLVALHGGPYVIVPTHPQSNARFLGMRFGVLSWGDYKPTDPIVEIVE